MRNFVIALLFLFAAASAHQTNAYLGPNFNYVRIHSNSPNHLEGYMGGITAGAEYRHWHFRGSLDFEGSWNAGPITGKPAQRSTIYEYFLELKTGATFSWDNWRFEPYTGFGWDRFNQNPQTAEISFLYDKLFIPIGFYVHYLFQNFSPGFQFEFRPDVYKNLETLSTDLNPRWGYGFRTELSLKQFFPFSWGRLSLNFAPFYDWNRFGKASAKNSVGAVLKIPRLLRWTLGLRVLLGAEF